MSAIKPELTPKDMKAEAYEIKAPEVTLESPEERRAHRDKVGREVVEQYLSGSKFESRDVTVEQAMQELGAMPSLDAGGDALEDLGISKDKLGKYRLRKPGEKGVPGSWERPDVLKAFLAGFAGAENVKGKLEVIAKVHEYLGLPYSAQYLELTEEEEKATNLPMSTWSVKLRRMGKALQPFIAGLVLFLGSSGHMQREFGSAKPEVASASRGEGGEMEVGAAAESEAASSESEASPTAEVYTLKEGETVWGVVAEKLRAALGKASSAEIQMVTKKVCDKNGIRDEGVGAKHGIFNSTKLRTGTKIDISDARAYAEARQALSGR